MCGNFDSSDLLSKIGKQYSWSFHNNDFGFRHVNKYCIHYFFRNEDDLQRMLHTKKDIDTGLEAFDEGFIVSGWYSQGLIAKNTYFG